jgi:hypothetical protein
MDLEIICPASNDDQILTQSFRSTRPAAKHDRSLWPSGQRQRPTR